MSKNHTKKEYQDYISSPEWKAKRGEYMASNRPKKCHVCGKLDGSMHMHHRTYVNFKKEKLEDLVRVHPDCHQLIHKLHKIHNSKSLWEITDYAAEYYAKNKTFVANSKKKKKQPKQNSHAELQAEKENKANHRSIRSRARERRENRSECAMDVRCRNAPMSGREYCEHHGRQVGLIK